MPRVLLLSLALLIVAACGGGGGGTTGGGGGGGTGPNEAGKIQFAADMGAKMNTWKALAKDQRHANLVAWAKTQAGVADAGISAESNTVWILFTDGDGTVYFDNTDPSPVDLRPTVAPAPKVADMPTDTHAAVIWSLEDHKFRDVTGSLLLDLNNAGYQTTRYKNPSVADLLALQDDAVIFWQSHSGELTDKRNGVTRKQWAIMTGEVCTTALGTLYQVHRDAGDLFVAAREKKDAQGNISTEPVYAITESFITKNMSFTPNSFVAMDSCTSSHFGATFRAKGAGTFVGWDALSGFSSGDNFLLMFDRLLGANIEPPISVPLERSFDIDAVQGWMTNKNYILDSSPGGNANMTFSFTGEKSLMLKPTIARVLIEANDAVYNKTKYLIEGTFGKDPGAANRQVTWGGQTMDVLDWRELEGIRIKVPAAVPSGEIQVVKRGRRSNRVPMTEYTIPFTYTYTGKGSLTYTVKLNIKLRADLRGFRFEPEQDVSYLPMAFWQLADSTGTITASGSYNDGTQTISYAGGTAVKGFDGPATGKDEIIFQGNINTQTGAIEGYVMACTGSFKRTVTTKSGSTTTDRQAVLEGFSFFSIPINKTTLGIAAGSTPQTQGITGDGVSATLSWTAVTPANKPDDFTPRRPGR